MGSSQGKEAGIQDYQLWTLVGYIVQTYEDALANRRSYDDAQNVILFHLKELSRYALNPKKSPNPDNVYFNGQPQLVIHEKYRHSDGQHAWSLTIQLNPTLRMFKLIHGTPTVRESGARRDVSMTETLQPSAPGYTKNSMVPPSPANSGNNGHTGTNRTTQQTVYPPPGSHPSYSRNSLPPTRPSHPAPTSQPRSTNNLPTMASTPRGSNPGLQRNQSNNPVQTRNRTTLPNHPTLPMEYPGDFNNTNYSNLAQMNPPGSQRMPVIENDQIAQNLGDMNRSNPILEASHIPAQDEEFNLNRFS